MPAVEPLSPGEALLDGALSPGPAGGRPAPLADVQRRPAADIANGGEEESVPARQPSPRRAHRKPAADVVMDEDDGDEDVAVAKNKRAKGERCQSKTKQGKGTAAKTNQDKAAAGKATGKSSGTATSPRGVLKKPTAPLGVLK